jgi:hypothetical protein
MEFITGILHLVPHIIVVIAVIIYVSKKSTPEGTLMLIGSIVSLLLSAIYTLAIPFLIRVNEYESMQSYIGLLSMVSMLGSLLFAIGFLLVIKKVVAEK